MENKKSNASEMKLKTRKSQKMFSKSASPEPSVVSMKSDVSIGLPPNLSDGSVTSDCLLKSQRRAHAEPSVVSMKSDVSIGLPPNLSDGSVTSDCLLKSQRRAHPEPSVVSMKSDVSIGLPPNLSDGSVTSDCLLKSQRRAHPEPSVVSMKSDVSIGLPPNLSDGSVTSDCLLKSQRRAHAEPSVVSMKSDVSIGLPPNLSDGSVTSDCLLKSPRGVHEEPSVVSMKSDVSIGLPPNLSDGSVTSDCLLKSQRRAHAEPSVVSVKSDVSIGLPPNLSDGSVTSDCLGRSNIRCEHDVSRDVQQDQAVDDVLQRVKDKHKRSMKNKYESLFEGIKIHENQTLLERIYTQLYIIEGESEGVNEEHEVLHMEKKPRNTQDLQDTPIYCNDIFKALKPQAAHKTQKIKSVLTKGIAGIGKTVSVQKFILDWAERTANQDVDFIFLLPFRELNLIRDGQYSLHKLLLDFHPELQDLDSKIYKKCKVVFIFDGLDESRITLMFSDGEKVSDVTKTSSVSVLMSNLMKGDLLPSALIWITSRPAAANQIPSRYIQRLTEILGFNDDQKEKYFRKRISDERQADRIISHIRRARSLHIMCHIPVFCWISSTVLQNILQEDNERAKIPQTLTEMYIYFLLIQINMKNEKYDPERDAEKLLQYNRDVIVKLADVAFKQLLKGNVMFYEEDLQECGIDITDASLYSGICTQIFKEESVIHQRKIYSFIHLSFQEFLAALHVLYCHLTKNTESLQLLLEEKYENYRSKEISLYQLLESAVDKAVQSKTGHLDLFLRFQLGILLTSSQRLLQDLLTDTENNSSRIIGQITNYIENKIKSGHEDDDDNDDGHEHLPADRSINLFLCLSEVNDQSLYKEIEEFVRSDTRIGEKLSAAHCSAIAYMLQMSEEVMEELDVNKFITTQEGRRRLIPAVINCTRALLQRCNLSRQCYESLSSCLQSSNSLRELDLSNSDLQDSGVKLISDALKSHSCKLEILRLITCNLSRQCCESLSSCLQSSNSLRELDLSNNDLQDSGVKLISDALKSHSCKLEILRLSGCMVTAEGCGYLASALSLNPSHLRDLDLSYNHPEHSGVQLLSETLHDTNCTLNVDHGGKIRITAGPRKWICDLTLDPNTANSHLILSDENRKFTRVKDRQPYPDHPDRFDDVYQVLCSESLTGRCYWEAECSGPSSDLSVSYKSISRKELCPDSAFGFNTRSWSLICFDKRCTAWHRGNSTNIPISPRESNTVGVYLDWSAGILSFYSVSDTHTLTHLHTFYTKFFQPLHAGFTVHDLNSSVSLCDRSGGSSY